MQKQNKRIAFSGIIIRPEWTMGLTSLLPVGLIDTCKWQEASPKNVVVIFQITKRGRVIEK